MPIYEYRCKACGYRFEVFQKFSDTPLKKCKICPGEVERLISPAGFILKGNGFYVNDYPSKERKEALKRENHGEGKLSENKDTKDKAKSAA